MIKCTNVWFQTLGFSSPDWIIGLVFASAAYVLFWTGRFSAFEKIMAFIVSIMVFCFCLVVFMTPPGLGAFLKGLVFSIPKVTGSGVAAKSAFVIMGGMIGTTLAFTMVIARTSQAIDKNWQLEDMDTVKKDILNAVILILIINILIMAAAAGTVYKNKGTLNSVAEMISIFNQLGKSAPAIFLFGILAAGFSSLLPCCMMFCWLKNNAFNSQESMRTPKHRILTFITLFGGLAIALMGFRPVPLVIATQVTGCLVSPLIALFFIYTYNKKSIMRGHVSGWKLNVVLCLLFIFAFWMAFKTGSKLKKYILEDVLDRGPAAQISSTLQPWSDKNH
jgi:Mn2+/Fe2+ NRAMP family transporter